jgi:hypothetical protein
MENKKTITREELIILFENYIRRHCDKSRKVAAVKFDTTEVVIQNICLGRTEFKPEILAELGYKKREVMFDLIVKNGDV